MYLVNQLIDWVFVFVLVFILRHHNPSWHVIHYKDQAGLELVVSSLTLLNPRVVPLCQALFYNFKPAYSKNHGKH